MTKILTTSQLREVDRLSSEQFGVPSIILMENAGMRVVEAIDIRVDDLESLSVAILCGKGNNGGDGFVVARQLIQRGCTPVVVVFASPEDIKGDARINFDILTAIGCKSLVIQSEDEWNRKRTEILAADIVVDALLGTGLSRPVEGPVELAIESLKGDACSAMIVSVDVPSGCDADTSELPEISVEADLTVTFTALKACHVFPPTNELAGEVVIAEIGNPKGLLNNPSFNLNLLLVDSFSNTSLAREQDTNKGNYGKVLVVAGSRGKTGAAAMAGQAALQSGAGLVTVAAPGSALPAIAAHMPEVMTEELPETDEGTMSGEALASGRIEEIIEGKSVVAVGPGLGSHPETFALVRRLLPRFRVPVVLDADGLNAFEGHVDELRGNEYGVVITPHPAEMARLKETDVASVVRNRLEISQEFACNHEVYVILKGFRTIVACPDGTMFVNTTGNAGMASAGTGDILTGMLAGMIGQPQLGHLWERICLGVFLHGLSGDIAALEIGEHPLVATDLLRFLPEAWAEFVEG